MDSINLPEAQNTPLNCKNTACNTSPLACTCCGSKDYLQTFPQAYCFSPLHPGMTRCKHSQDSYEENFSFQQPFVSRLPFFPSFFHKTSASNFCCGHNHCDETNKQQRHTSEHESTRTGSYYNSCPQERNDFMNNKTILDEDLPKQNNVLGPDFPFLWSPINLSNPADSQINSFFQRCACGDSVPWTCSPFIAPIISYCLFWNSQKPNVNVLSNNYKVGKSENLCHSNNDSLGANKNFPKPNDEKEKFSSNFDLEVEAKNSTQDSGFEIDQQTENTDQNSGKSSTFLSLNSLNYHEENSLKIMEKEDQNRTVDTCTGEEDSETEGFDSEQEDSDEGLKSDEKVIPNNNSDLDLSQDSNENSKDKEGQSLSESQSFSDVKTRKNSAHSMDVSLTENQVPDVSDAGEGTFHSLQDQTDSVPFNEAQISETAAGDLGGVNCDGYKVHITAFEENREEAYHQDTQDEENSESTEFLAKDSRNCEENTSESLPEKSNENLKSSRSAKTGIAKLIQNLKSRDQKSDSIKNNKQNKESHSKESTIIKRKHNCFSIDNPVGVGEKNMKIHKTRNCSVVQQQFTGPEKKHKEASSKSLPVKKEAKTSTAKVRPVSNTQKPAKCSSKK